MPGEDSHLPDYARSQAHSDSGLWPSCDSPASPARRGRGRSAFAKATADRRSLGGGWSAAPNVELPW
jgi:hypothetical protein